MISQEAQHRVQMNYLIESIRDGRGFLCLTDDRYAIIPQSNDKHEFANDCVEQTGKEIIIYEVAISKPFRRIPDSVVYHDYITSDKWIELATMEKELAGWRCRVCNHHKDDVALHAHHRTYENLGNEQPGDITVLCADCHSLYHGKG